MNIIYNPKAPIINEGAVVAFGTFDGLHLGHMALVNKLNEYKNFKRVAFTFSNNPSKIAHNIDVKYIISAEYKQILFKNLELDILVVQDFTKEFMNIEAEDFFYEYIVKILCAKKIIVGYNYVFGKKNKGNINLLSKLCIENNIELNVMPPVKINDIAISSTYIRRLIKNGEIKSANTMLGRPFAIYGQVILGKQLGRVLGFPTANMMVDDGQTLPPDGVYVTSTEINGEVYKSISNLGGKPTIENGYRALETYIIGFDGDLYGENIAVYFHKKIRGIKQFDTIDQLKKQIANDNRIANEYFDNNLFTI